VLHLPEHVRGEERAGDRGREPGPGRSEPAAFGRRHEAHGEPEAEPEHADLVEEAEAEQHAEPEPRARIGAVPDTRQHERGAAPERGLEAVHRVEARDAQIDRGDPRRERRQALGGPPAAELARQQRHHDNRPTVRQRREELDREERVAERLVHEPQERRRQRRVVHVPPRQPPRALQVVELVGHVVVRQRPGGEQVNGEAHGRERGQGPPDDGLARKRSGHGVSSSMPDREESKKRAPRRFSPRCGGAWRCRAAATPPKSALARAYPAPGPTAGPAGRRLRRARPGGTPIPCGCTFGLVRERDRGARAVESRSCGVGVRQPCRVARVERARLASQLIRPGGTGPAPVLRDDAPLRARRPVAAATAARQGSRVALDAAKELARQFVKQVVDPRRPLALLGLRPDPAAAIEKGRQQRHEPGQAVLQARNDALHRVGRRRVLHDVPRIDTGDAPVLPRSCCTSSRCFASSASSLPARGPRGLTICASEMSPRSL